MTIKRTDMIFKIDSEPRKKTNKAYTEYMDQNGKIIKKTTTKYCGYVKTDEYGIKTYSVKTNQSNVLFDPNSKEAPALDKKIAQRISTGSEIYKNIDVNLVVFNYYQKFLQDRNKSFLNIAQRELLNEKTKISGVTIMTEAESLSGNDIHYISDNVPVTKSKKIKSK